MRLAWSVLIWLSLVLSTGCTRDDEKARLEKDLKDVLGRLNAIERKPSAPLAQLRQEYEDLHKTKSPDAGRYAVLILLGQTYTLDGSYGKALQLYHEAQQLLPTVADAYYAIGDVYYDFVLVEPALDRTYRFDSAEPVVPVQSREKTQRLLTAVLHQYEIGHQYKTLRNLYPAAPRELTSRVTVDWRESQAKKFVKDNAQQIVLHRSEVVKLTSWAMHFNPQSKVRGESPRPPGPGRPLSEIIREIEPDLKVMMTTISSHTLLQKMAADFRKNNQLGVNELKQRTSKDPSDAIAKFTLGYVYMMQMDYDLSLKEYERGCDLLPTALDCWIGLGRVLYNIAASYMTVEDLCAPRPPACQGDAPARRVVMAADEIVEKGALKSALIVDWERGNKVLQAVSNPAAVASLRDDIRIALKRD